MKERERERERVCVCMYLKCICSSAVVPSTTVGTVFLWYALCVLKNARQREVTAVMIKRFDLVVGTVNVTFV